MASIDQTKQAASALPNELSVDQGAGGNGPGLAAGAAHAAEAARRQALLDDPTTQLQFQAAVNKADAADALPVAKQQLKGLTDAGRRLGGLINKGKAKQQAAQAIAKKDLAAKQQAPVGDGKSAGVLKSDAIKLPLEGTSAGKFLANLPKAPAAPAPIDVPNSPIDPNQTMLDRVHNFMKRPTFGGSAFTSPYAMVGAGAAGLGAYALYKMLAGKNKKEASWVNPLPIIRRNPVVSTAVGAGVGAGAGLAAGAQTATPKDKSIMGTVTDYAGKAHNWAKTPLFGESDYATPYAMAGYGAAGLGAYALYKMLNKDSSED